MHIVAHRTPGDTSQVLGSSNRNSIPINAGDYHVRVSLSDFILSGVFQRHPDLKVLSVEHEGSWVFHFLQRLDWHYQYNRLMQMSHRFPDGYLPSDYFRQNVVVCFSEDPFLIKYRDVIGSDNISWGSDFPHSESLFSMSHASLASQLEGVPDDERLKITVTNTARLYGFELPPPRGSSAS
jgi:predicted TIM-barrel fold metal-dependent hydrolase